MADQDHSLRSRNYPPNHLSSGGGGTGLFWALFAVAALGVLVLIGAIGGGSTGTEHPGGAGADPVVVEPDPAALPAEGTTIVE